MRSPEGRQGPEKRSGPGPRPPERYRAAKELIARAEANETHGGERWTRHDLAGFAREDRALLRGSTGPAEHAHRIGLDRRRFEALGGPEREQAEQRIEKARRRDVQRLEVGPESDRHPALDRPRLALERIRQVGEGAVPERREHLRSLRRERRSRDHLAPRRNLSRGA